MFSNESLQQAQRRRAIRMARVGLAEHIIALRLGLDLPDLRSLCATPMRNAAIDAHLRVWEALLTMAQSGKNITATIFWLKVRAGVIVPSAPKPPAQKAKKDDKEFPRVIPPPEILRVIGPNGQICT